MGQVSLCLGRSAEGLRKAHPVQKEKIGSAFLRPGEAVCVLPELQKACWRLQKHISSFSENICAFLRPLAGLPRLGEAVLSLPRPQKAAERHPTATTEGMIPRAIDPLPLCHVRERNVKRMLENIGE